MRVLHKITIIQIIILVVMNIHSGYIPTALQFSIQLYMDTFTIMTYFYEFVTTFI